MEHTYNRWFFDTFSGAWDSLKLDEENFVNYFSSGLSSSQDELVWSLFLSRRVILFHTKDACCTL
jgi:hypothetical protein